MGIEANKDIVRRFLQELGDGHLDQAAKLFADNCRYWILGVGDLDMKAVKGFWAQVFSSAPGPSSMTINGLTAEGERVAAEMSSNLKLPNGNEYRNTYHILYVIRDGKIIEVREYMDTAYAQKAFGTAH